MGSDTLGSEGSCAEVVQEGVGDEKSGIRRKDTNLTVETEYVHMLLELDCIHWIYNFLPGFASWILMAGYLVVPGTFTTLQSSHTVKQELDTNPTKKAVLNTFQNPPLIGISCSLLVIGALTMTYLFFRWKQNYFWLINRLFIQKWELVHYGSSNGNCNGNDSVLLISSGTIL
ncbi:hypothetical protein BDV40DRAFT_310990 [Aspergillus tamarii]|uniref:Uncharacterized protein n=1 Tax=Aspergillus tamarii TaxID=41984 RepID=A0A5N6UAD6_ASPTM|nr:hypothetical protein BDV40DRAFT_310990 [Aspergillus tamarii]